MNNIESMLYELYDVVRFNKGAKFDYKRFIRLLEEC